jgi:6-phospho-3-hexuloisomerase
MDNKNIAENERKVAAEIFDTLTRIDPGAIESAMKLIRGTGRKFFLGLGRGGLAVKAFEMRLFHLGFQAFEVWGINTPPVAQNDLLVIVSCSGNTETTVNIAEKAKAYGAKIMLFTTNPDSVLGRMADSTIRIQAPSMKISGGKDASVQLMNSLFEQSVFIIGDIITLCLTQEMQLEPQEIEKNHANLE